MREFVATRSPQYKKLLLKEPRNCTEKTKSKFRNCFSIGLKKGKEMDNEFEKWWNKTYPRANEFVDCEKLKEITIIGWKAALEWVLKFTDDAFMPSRHTIEQELRKPTPTPNEN